MTATHIVVLFLVLGYVAFIAWIMHSSRQRARHPGRVATQDEQAMASRDTAESVSQRKVA